MHALKALHISFCWVKASKTFHHGLMCSRVRQQWLRPMGRRLFKTSSSRCATVSCRHP